MRFFCSKIAEHLRPKTTENLRRKTEQVFTNNEYCHSNGKFHCHTKQIDLVRIVRQNCRTIVEQIRQGLPRLEFDNQKLKSDDDQIRPARNVTNRCAVNNPA
jgi:hypothetical protein